MLLSEQTIDLLDPAGPNAGKLDELIEGSEFSRATFLKGGGALVVGFSLVGAALAGSAKGASARVAAAGPPNAALVDSWVAIHAGQHGHDRDGKDRHHRRSHRPAADRGRGARPDDPAGQARALEHRHLAEPGHHRRVELDLGGGPQVRQAAAEARAVLLGLAAKQLGVAVSDLQVTRRRRLVEERLVEERHLRRAARRQAVLGPQHGSGAAEAGDGVPPRRQAREAEGHRGEGARARTRTCISSGCRGCCTAASSARRARGRSRSPTRRSRSTRARSRTSRARRSTARATSSASSRRTSRTRSRPRRS